jgi:hypothetical protein
MYKVEISYDFVSPCLGVVSGEIRIGEIDMGMLPEDIHERKFTFRKEHGSLSYKNCPAAFQRVIPITDIMIKSYYDGMRLSDYGISWFSNSYRKNNIVTVNFFD